MDFLSLLFLKKKNILKSLPKKPDGYKNINSSSMIYIKK
jgi:hypothetical protein